MGIASSRFCGATVQGTTDVGNAKGSASRGVAEGARGSATGRTGAPVGEPAWAQALSATVTAMSAPPMEICFVDRMWGSPRHRTRCGDAWCRRRGPSTGRKRGNVRGPHCSRRAERPLIGWEQRFSSNIAAPAAFGERRAVSGRMPSPPPDVGWSLRRSLHPRDVGWSLRRRLHPRTPRVGEDDRREPAAAGDSPSRRANDHFPGASLAGPLQQSPHVGDGPISRPVGEIPRAEIISVHRSASAMTALCHRGSSLLARRPRGLGQGSGLPAGHPAPETASSLPPSRLGRLREGSTLSFGRPSAPPGRLEPSEWLLDELSGRLEPFRMAPRRPLGKARAFRRGGCRDRGRLEPSGGVG